MVNNKPEDKNKDNNDIEKDNENGNIVFALDNETRDKIIRFLLKSKISNSNLIQKELNLGRQVAEVNLKNLENANIIQLLRPPHNKKRWEEKYNNSILNKIQDIYLNENNRELILYYLDTDKFVEILKKLFKSYIPKGSYFESAILEDYKIMATSIEFMENIVTNGWMDICFPAKSTEFAAIDPVYTKGYEKMKERGITIRVITEITKDNFNYLNKMIQNGHVDEIRILKKVNCGIAVSETQYMAAKLDKDPKNSVIDSYFATAIYHTEKKAIEMYQSVFDTLWENAITIFKK
jgi:ribosomal protein S25